MADAYTTVTTANDVVTTAYDLKVYDALRPQLYFDQFATFRATKQSHRGATVQFQTSPDLAPATTPLSETVDVDAVAISTDPVTLSLAEYGNAVITTAKLRGTGFVDFDPIAAQKIGYNAGLTVDTLARTALEATTNVQDDSGAANNLTSARVRTAFVKLTEANVMPFDGTFYIAFIHPRQAYDLKSETGNDGWRLPQVYQGSLSNGILRGEIGEYEGFRFIVTPRVTKTGTGATAAFNAIFLGEEGLAKGYSLAPEYGPMPQVVVGNQTDKLKRFVPVGWKWFGAYGVFRNESIYMNKTRSSLGG